MQGYLHKIMEGGDSMKNIFQYVFAKRLLDTKNGKMHSVFALDVRRFFKLKKLLGGKVAFSTVMVDMKDSTK